MEFHTQLDDEALMLFHMGHHVCRHKDGSWNAVSADQFGEQTYIRQGKAKGGLVGITLSPDQVTRWFLSHHICNTVSQGMDKMFEGEEEDYDVQSDKHKEEGNNRRKLDADDRKKVLDELKKYPHPLKHDSVDLINIVNGHIGGEKVNVHNALAIGECMASEFKGNMPSGFYKPSTPKYLQWRL